MEETHDQADSIIIGNCLSCQGLVRVPVRTSAKSRVRCPHCSESYWLWEVLDQSVPELEVVSELNVESSVAYVDQGVVGEFECESSEEPQKFVVPSQLVDGAKRSRRRRRSGETSSPDIFIEPISVDETNVKSSRSRSGRRPSDSREVGSSQVQRRYIRSKRNNVFEFLKIAMGGVLAIPIAYLIVFWVFQKDPLNLGPGISSVAPFAVPAQFRGPDSEAE